MDMIEHQILDLLRDKDEDITINEIASSIKKERHTTAKRLEMMRSKGLVEYRTIGKSKVWKLSKSPFLSALKSNDDISNNIKSLLAHVDGEVNIQDKDTVLWSSHKDNSCCSKAERCKDCAVEKTFKTGKVESSTRKMSKKKVKIIAQPIKDNRNNTVAVMEIIRDVK